MLSALVNGLLLILIGLRLVIGGQLFFSARRNQLPNLYWLSAFFIVNFFGVPFAATSGNPLAAWPGAMWIFNAALTLTAGPLLVRFIETTFYTHRRSPGPWFWGAYVFFGGVGLYGLTQSAHGNALAPPVASFFLLSTLVWGWHGVAALEAYRAIAADRSVAGWVKLRYQLLIGSAGFQFLSALISMARILLTGNALDNPLGSTTALLALLGNLGSIGLQVVVWGFPEQFRQWVSQVQARQSAATAARQAEVIFDLLRAAMARNTGLTEFFAGYALRTIVGHIINTTDPAQIDQQVTQLGYQDWLGVLDHPALGPLLLNAAVGANANQAIQQAKQALHDRQALFTLQAH